MPGGTLRLGPPPRWLKQGGRRCSRSSTLAALLHPPPALTTTPTAARRGALAWALPLAAVGAVCMLYLVALQWWSGQLLERTLSGALPAGPLASTGGGGSGSSRDILVLYVFAYTDTEYLNNLRYFVKEAITGDDRARYIIAVQMINQIQDITLPELPSHAKYVSHTNECYDWGTFGWLLLSSGQTDYRQYKYFVFINSSVRGPYLPAYARGLHHWTDPFLHRLTSRVKLVGSTISCEGSPLEGSIKGNWRRNPHVQSYAVATDMVGLGLLLKDGKVFQCHRDRWQAIYYSELGSSAVLLRAGYNIGCLMIRYQGVDWRDKKMWDCNARLTPTGEQYNDGISLDPLEVLFVKVKSHMLDNHLSVSTKAARYEQWQALQAPGATVNLTALAENEYLRELPRFKTPHVLEMRARGARCFDFDFYLLNNPDISDVGTSEDALWKHFVYYGQFDARPFRFTCDLDYEKLTNW